MQELLEVLNFVTLNPEIKKIVVGRKMYERLKLQAKTFMIGKADDFYYAEFRVKGVLIECEDDGTI